jgi:transposase
MEKTEAHKLPRVVLNERRRFAVKLRLNGATIAETVAQCELGRSEEIRAMQAYERAGSKAVAVPIVGRPSGSGRQLTAEQEMKIQQLIQDRTPDQLKLTYALWTRQVVSELIESVYGVRCVVEGAQNTKIMIDFMKRHVHGRLKSVCLILDNLRVHYSKTAKKWLAENE